MLPGGLHGAEGSPKAVLIRERNSQPTGDCKSPTHSQTEYVTWRKTGGLAALGSGQGGPAPKANMLGLAEQIGRVTTKQLPLSEGTVTYTYDINTGSSNARGRLAKLYDPAQTKTFSYDKLGRTKKEIRTHKTVTHTQLNVNYETEYEYDLLGRLK